MDLLARQAGMGGYVGPHRRPSMAGLARRALFVLSFIFPAHIVAQTQKPVVGSAAAWTVRLNRDVRWQQVTPAGGVVVSTEGALSGVGLARGGITWQKPGLGGR